VRRRPSAARRAAHSQEMAAETTIAGRCRASSGQPSHRASVLASARRGTSDRMFESCLVRSTTVPLAPHSPGPSAASRVRSIPRAPQAIVPNPFDELRWPQRQEHLACGPPLRRSSRVVLVTHAASSSHTACDRASSASETWATVLRTVTSVRDEGSRVVH